MQNNTELMQGEVYLRKTRYHWSENEIYSDEIKLKKD